MLVIITKRYDSAVLGQKVYPTLMNEDGSPINPCNVSEERAKTLIEAGYAIEYKPVTDDNISENNDDEDEDTSENNDNEDENTSESEEKDKKKTSRKTSKK